MTEVRLPARRPSTESHTRPDPAPAALPTRRELREARAQGVGVAEYVQQQTVAVPDPRPVEALPTRRALREAREDGPTPSGAVAPQTRAAHRQARAESAAEDRAPGAAGPAQGGSPLARRVAVGLGVTGVAALTGCSVVAEKGGAAKAGAFLGIGDGGDPVRQLGRSISRPPVRVDADPVAQPVQRPSHRPRRSTPAATSTPTSSPTAAHSSSSSSARTRTSGTGTSTSSTGTSASSTGRPTSTPSSASGHAGSRRRPTEKAPNSLNADESAVRSQPGARALKPGRQYSGFAAAAAAAAPVAAGPHDPAGRELHLLRRATFGPGPGDLEEVRRKGIDGWLSEQLSPESIADPDGERAWDAFGLAGASVWQIVSSIAGASPAAMDHTTRATIASQVHSRRQLFEVVCDVFANHLHVPLPSETWCTSPRYVTEVIRKHALGRYEDMLLAAMRHPAMLLYLQNTGSDKKEMNENLGRELLELHTVGLGSGFTEQDVRNSSRILTGRSYHLPGIFTWRPEMHYVGPVTVLGFTHPNGTAAGGLAAGDAYLRYLAHHPATARNICRKLAVRFVADNPSSNLIDRLSKVYLDSGTDITAVLRALFSSTDFWNAVGAKFRRPLEDAVGVARALGPATSSRITSEFEDLHLRLVEAGQTPFRWSTPDGYPDVAPAWLSSGAMLSRWRMHRYLVGRAGHAGWRSLDTVVPLRRGQTVAQWVDESAVRLLGEKLRADHRDILIRMTGRSAHQPSSSLRGVVQDVVPLFFDSPYFLLR